MASLLSPRRTDSDISLRATLAHTERLSDVIDEPEPPRVGWLFAAVGGALAAALSGWVLIVGLTVIGWLAAEPGSFLGAVEVGTQLWLLANGAGAELGTTRVTLVPWGATFVFAFMVSRFAGVAVRQVRGRELSSVAAVTGVMVLAYAVPVVGIAGFLDGSAHALRALLAVALVVGLSAWRGSCRSLGYHPSRSWPGWCRPVPRAVLGAQLTMVVIGAGALAASIVVHFDRVSALTTGLHAGLAGGIVLLLAQLIFLPNAIVWAASYTLGAGFTLGAGTVVTPPSTQIGLLPSIPLFGALPSTGPGTASDLWWLTSGVLAGAVAAWLVMKARPAARIDETALVGGLSGLVAGAVFAGVAWASGGDLGSARLAGVGPRLVPLLILATTTMGLAGMLVGLVVGLLRRPRERRGAGPDVPGAGDDAVRQGEAGSDDGPEELTVPLPRPPTA